MKKIAFVCQRYGKEVDGGAEHYTKLMAQHLSRKYSVEILTTKAISYDSWNNYYQEGLEIIDGIPVRRFAVKGYRKTNLQKILGKIITLFHFNFEWINKLWIKAQGPYVPTLVKFIQQNKDNYDLFVFITYLYYPTIYSLPTVKNKSVFVPTAHDEPYIYFKLFKKLFLMPRAFVYLTEEEKKFVHQTFANKEFAYITCGIGIDQMKNINADNFREKFKIAGDYYIYVGRVDKDKGCDEMFDYFINYQEKHPEAQLVILGKSYMEIPKHSNIIYLGYVTEEDKYNGIKGAKALWLPSVHESLSISVLESLSLGVPIVVNEKCKVLKDHCEKSSAGYAYNNYEECYAALEHLNYEEYDELCKNGIEYIKQYYSWINILDKWECLIEKVTTK